MDVNRLPVEHGTTGHRAPSNRQRRCPHRDQPLYRYSLKDVTIEAKNHGVLRVTQPRRIFGHRIQHRLKIGRRPGDDAQDLARGRLLLRSLGKLSLAGIKLLGDAL